MEELIGKRITIKVTDDITYTTKLVAVLDSGWLVLEYLKDTNFKGHWYLNKDHIITIDPIQVIE